MRARDALGSGELYKQDTRQASLYSIYCSEEELDQVSGRKQDNCKGVELNDEAVDC